MLIDDGVFKKKMIVNYDNNIENEKTLSCYNLRNVYIIDQQRLLSCCAMGGDLRNDTPFADCDIPTNTRNIKFNAEKAKQFDIVGLTKELENRNALDIKEPIQYSAREITIAPNKKEILDYLEKYPLQIFTNAVIYDETVEKLTLRNGSFLSISIDAGTKETYRIVKGLDVYNKVVENIKRYKENGCNMELKYIVLNENVDECELEGFIQLCKDVKPNMINISTDFRFDHKNLGQNINEAAKFLIMEAQKNGLPVRLLSIFSEHSCK